jgi:Ca-activated chloride channel family protein
MFELAQPWLFLLLPLPWVLRRLLPPAPETGGAALRLPFFSRVAELSAGPGRRSGGYRARLCAAYAAWALAVASAAQPQWLGPPVALPLEGRDLMLAVDLSGSMELPDFDLDGQPVTRLDVVKATASRFIQKRSGDRIGLILFGTRAYLQTPLTFDRKTVLAMLSEAQIGLAGKQTAIGDAIGLAVKRLRNTLQKQRVLVLLTDGANTAGEVDPVQAAKLAAAEGLRIYTIGLGANTLEVPTLFGTRMVNPSSDLDEGTLKEIAQTTHGRYFRAADTEGLEQIYRELDRLEPRSTDTETFRPVTPLFYWPLGAALLISALIAMLASGRLRSARSRVGLAEGEVARP